MISWKNYNRVIYQRVSIKTNYKTFMRLDLFHNLSHAKLEQLQYSNLSMSFD